MCSPAGGVILVQGLIEHKIVQEDGAGRPGFDRVEFAQISGIVDRPVPEHALPPLHKVSVFYRGDRGLRPGISQQALLCDPGLGGQRCNGVLAEGLCETTPVEGTKQQRQISDAEVVGHDDQEPFLRPAYGVAHPVQGIVKCQPGTGPNVVVAGVQPVLKRTAEICQSIAGLPRPVAPEPVRQILVHGPTHPILFACESFGRRREGRAHKVPQPVNIRPPLREQRREALLHL